MFSGQQQRSSQPPTDSAPRSAAELSRIRIQIHQKFLHNIEMSAVGSQADHGGMQQQLDRAIDEVMRTHELLLSSADIQQIRKTITDEILGLGPLADLMLDPQLTDILVNGPKDVWIDKDGRLQKTAVTFDDEAHVRRVLDRLISGLGKHLDEGSPSVDARLSDGSRLHAIIPPLCARGSVISIRRFRQDTVDADTLLAQGCLTPAMLTLLLDAVKSRKNIVIAGGAGAGKTTLLNVLASHIPADERIITAEETAELKFDHPHVISLETRAVNSEGRGDVRLRDLVRNALRMRADRIIVGEVRGEEVLDMLQAMNVGHDGSLTTVHANSARDVVLRLETLALLNATTIPRAAITNMISAAIDLIVHIARFRDGKRRITNITALQTPGGQAVLRELYRFNVHQHGPGGAVLGQHEKIDSDATDMTQDGV